MQIKKLLCISLPTLLIAAAVATRLMPERHSEAPELVEQVDRRFPDLPLSADQRARVERALAADIDAVERGKAINSFDGELGWTNRPGRDDHGGFPVEINARGGRGAAPSHAAQSEVVCYGESFTYGTDVGDADCWPAQLGALEADLAVWNMGVGGYGSDQALLRFRHTIDRFDADVVLFGYMTENIARNVNRYRNVLYPTAPLPVVKPRFVLRGERLELVPLPFETRSAGYTLALAGELTQALGPHEFWLDPSAHAKLGGSRWIKYYGDLTSEPARVSLALLETSVREARERGADSAVVWLPAQNDLARVARGEAPYWLEFQAALRQRGVSIIDGASALTAEVERGTAIRDLYVKSHFSPLGNRIIAETVYTWLGQR